MSLYKRALMSRWTGRTCAALLTAGALVSQASPATAAGAVVPHASRYTGNAFDICKLPAVATLRAWSRSPFHAVAIYVGGANEGCPQRLSTTWVRAATAAGWNLIPTYVGLQAPHPRCGCHPINPARAYTEGTAGAADAVSHLAKIGIARGNIVYDDMEGYTRGKANSPAVLAFLAGWTAQLHHEGYLSGVYSSASSGISDLVTVAHHSAHPYPVPDDIWIADWNGRQTTSDPWVPHQLWAFHQRLHQYNGGESPSYGGVRLSIDGDFCDGAVVSRHSL